MVFDESKHPRDDDGKFTDKASSEKSLRDKQMKHGLEDGRHKYYRDRMETIQSQTKESHQKEISAVTIVELDKDNELSKLILASNQSKYKKIFEKDIIFTILFPRNKKNTAHRIYGVWRSRRLRNMKRCFQFTL